MNNKIFKIEFQETLSETVEIEAKNLDEAILKAKQMYNEEKVILNEANFVKVEFKFAE